jgi:hypothetical protein
LTASWPCSIVQAWGERILLFGGVLIYLVTPVVFLLPFITVSADEAALGMVIELTEAKLLELIESAYPNPVTVEELATQHGWAADAVSETLTALQEKGLVQALEHGAFTRAGKADSHVQVHFMMLDGTVENQRFRLTMDVNKCTAFSYQTELENVQFGKSSVNK